MKYCEEYAALLDLFVDGELPREEMERVRGHLAECPGCQAYVDGALALRAGFPDVEDTVVPEGFAEGVMERIRAFPGRDAKAAEQKRRNFRRWTGTAAALAACCGLVILARTGSGGPAGGESPMARTEIAAASAGGAAEAGIEPRMAPEEETAQVQETAKNAALDSGSPPPGAEEGRSLMAAAAPTAPAEAALTESEDAVDGVASYDEIALCLTAEEVGDLLDGFTPEREDESRRFYRLNAMEYETLLEDLGRWEKLPDSPEAGFQVVVTGPFK